MRSLLSAVISAGVLACASTAFAQTTVWTNQGDFVNFLQPGYFETDFATIATGSQPAYAFGGGGFNATATASTGDLFNAPGILSTDLQSDMVVINFVPGVHAVGGHFWASDINFNPTGAAVLVTLADGTVENVANTTSTTFRGFTNFDTPIASLTVDAPGANWPTVSHFWMGNPIPEPATLGLLGLSGLALIRRRR